MRKISKKFSNKNQQKSNNFEKKIKKILKISKKNRTNSKNFKKI